MPGRMAALGRSRSPEGDGEEKTMTVPISEKCEHEADDTGGDWILLEDVGELAGEAELQRRRRGEAVDDVSSGDWKQQRPGALEERDTFDVIVRGGGRDRSRSKRGPPENDLWVVDLDLEVCMPMAVVALLTVVYIINSVLGHALSAPEVPALLLARVVAYGCASNAVSWSKPRPRHRAENHEWCAAPYFKLGLRAFTLLACCGFDVYLLSHGVPELLERFNTTARLFVGMMDGDYSTCAASNGDPISTPCTAAPFKKLIAGESYLRIFLRLYDVLATPGYNDLIEKVQQMGMLHCAKCVVVLYASFTSTVTIALVLAIAAVVLQANCVSFKIASTWNMCWQRDQRKGLIRFCREMPRLLSRCLFD
ncbi:uncharacterized protein LOC119458774 [Dermacentor silvarum]|uniref:uncharacterized protein LOC119458774 n=1 Tax=Dermacentor silvarum TaxID=543639 RepID=UPI002100EA49|nr:uncharacterized protein LOC119458774 [Dermacentor silvarum]